MKIIISGGGTGGHIYPALSILDTIKERKPDTEVLYIGTEGSLEESLATRAGYNFKSVTVKGMPRKINMESIKSGFALLKGLWEAKKILDVFEPDIVIGTGGYVSFPIVFMAQRKGILTYVQEQNAFPGKANRYLAKKAEGVFIAFEDAKERLDNKNIYMAGNPIDKKYNYLTKLDARKHMDLKEEDNLVVSFGGSGGQESINDAIVDIIKRGLPEDLKLIHITGKGHYEDFIDQLRDLNVTIPKNVEILDYSHQMPLLLSSADLVVMSSSAISLAEVEALNKKTILIPKSYTADNHQVYNARAFAKNNISKIILEQNLNGEVLLENIIEYLQIEDNPAPKYNQASEKIVDILLDSTRKTSIE